MDDNGASADDQLKVATGAPPCTDNSTMNVSQPGDAGDTYLVTQQFICEQSISGNDWIYCECTPRWQVSLMSTILEPKGYVIHKFVLEDKAVGYRYNRRRVGALAMDSRIEMIVPFERHVEQAGSRVNDDFGADQFFMATEAEERQEMKEWRALRRVPADPLAADYPNWDAVLLESQRVRLKAYSEQHAKLIREGRLLKDDDFIVDLDQNPAVSTGRSFHSDSASAATMITHGCFWRFRHKRPLLASEQGRMHAWPWTAEERARVGTVCSIPCLLNEGHVCCRDLSMMVGDSWSLRTQGSFLMWMLSSSRSTKFATIPRSLSMFRAMHGIESADADQLNLAAVVVGQ